MTNRLYMCRICGCKNFDEILNLGDQSLTGVFPKSVSDESEVQPLELIKCDECGLVQLAHNFNPSLMYGENYGYRSGLNQSMVEHLRTKALELDELIKIRPGDLVIDIGSNDGTFLGNFVEKGANLIGIDPTAEKFKSYYHPSIKIIADFFPTNEILKNSLKAKLITSIAMFYDLPDPVNFAIAIKNTLTPEGVWHFEQSYLPEMLKTLSYDTICHEHLEYYTLKVIERILNEAELKVVEVASNSTNGGSFAVTAAHKSSPYLESINVMKLRNAEEGLNLENSDSYQNFSSLVKNHKEKLLKILVELNERGKKIYGLGASTKGNVLLQYCQITPSLVAKIGEVNPEKFGKITPGTHIPIVSEIEMREENPDVLLVLPWHFKESIIKRETEFLDRGGTLLFPLPEITFVTKYGESNA